jgi:L,D-transpeptidase catalytic domain
MRAMAMFRPIVVVCSILTIVLPGRATALCRDDETVALARLERVSVRSGLRPQVLRSALSAYARARNDGVTRRPLLTVIDYSLPSSRPRFWVLDMETGRVLVRELVAHGRESGGDRAERFSNRPGSFQSSLGTFVTGGVYSGRHGRSLRLRGLDRGLNDQAEARAIVIHGADYVSEEFVRRMGRLGRSEGCPALRPAAARRVIDLIRDGTVVYAFYPGLK